VTIWPFTTTIWDSASPLTRQPQQPHYSNPIATLRSEHSNLVAKHDDSAGKPLKLLRWQFGKNYDANYDGNTDWLVFN
jgi:hypothetical protein